jgi:hypothetical protein
MDLLVEMIKIVEDNPKLDYPTVVKSYGTPPKQYKQVIAKEELNPDMALASLLSETEPEEEEEEVYKKIETGEEAVEEDDINSLEGEEGEEPELEEGEEGEGNEDFGPEEEGDDR